MKQFAMSHQPSRARRPPAPSAMNVPSITNLVTYRTFMQAMITTR
jgi:hypothetical protein